MSIRAVCAADPMVLAAIHAEGFPDDPWSIETFSALLALPAVFGVVATDGRGFALGQAAAGEGEILTICVPPGARRQGRGRTLLEGLGGLALLRGCGALFLEVAQDNHAARALYAAAGFVEVGRRKAYYMRADAVAQDALVLRLDLATAQQEQGGA